MSSDAAATDSAPRRAIVRTDLNLPDRRQGKVRDVYRVPPGGAFAAGGVLLVACDRLSAFDVVLPTPLPGKGGLLTEISTQWFDFIRRESLAATHLLSTDAADLPSSAFRAGSTDRAELSGRVTIGRACRVIPVECVVRGYLEGSGWADYRNTGAVCGVTLPAGLRQCDRLEHPIFTPATKAAVGEHDENISASSAAASIDPLARSVGRSGEELLGELERTSLAIFERASDVAARAGLILADTKFEFGLPVDASGEPTGEGPILIDEALTPDSSRYWDAGRYEPGRAQPSYDKQFVREHLQALVDRGEWDKTAPGPALPDEIVERTLDKYLEAVARLRRAVEQTPPHAGD